jgi:hypothetical protein
VESLYWRREQGCVVVNPFIGFREVVKHAFLLEVFDERRSGSTRGGSGQALAHLHTVPGSVDSRRKNPAQAGWAGHPVPGGRVAGVAPSVPQSGRERSDTRTWERQRYAKRKRSDARWKRSDTRSGVNVRDSWSHWQKKAGRVLDGRLTKGKCYG